MPAVSFFDNLSLMETRSVFQAIGGSATCRQLSEAFYGRVMRDTVLRPLFPGKTLRCATEEFAAFLVQFLGGPPEDTQHRWWLSLRESHLRFQLEPKHRAAWMKNMRAALDDVPATEPAREALREFFERSSAYVVNGDKAPEGGDELSGRWRAQRMLDEAVAAIRAGESERAIALAENAVVREHIESSRSAFAALLALMIRSDQAGLLNYVEGQLEKDPSLVKEQHAGKTLLHTAAGAGNLRMVSLMLRHGEAVDTLDRGDHTPLYSVANECGKPSGASVARALIAAGADVNASRGVKQCTPLHMAARRGHLGIANALIERGADIEARDSLGETPLRRAVNCNRLEVAALLLDRGADRHSVGSRRLTPVLAARTREMKALLNG